MGSIKKGEAFINVVFSGVDQYTNKLFGKNISLDHGILVVDYSHYSKRKRGNLEDSDFQMLKAQIGSIEKLQVSDRTVKSAIDANVPSSVHLKIDESTIVKLNAKNYDRDGGIISF